MLDRVYPSLDREKDEEAEEVGREQPGGDLTPLLAAGYVVDLVEPCVAHIHQQFTSDMVCTSTKTFLSYFPTLTVQATLQTFWSPLQRECVGM